MTFFLDEAVRETVQPAGGAVFNLLGAVSGRQTFANAKRFNGDAVENGDTTCVAVVQNIGGAVVRSVAIATLTLGGTNTLALNQTLYPSGKMYFSTEGSSFPTYNTGDTGEAFCTLSVPLAGLFDDDGNILQSNLYRQSLIPADLTAFLAQAALDDNEAVLALFRSGDAFSGKAGLFARNSASTGTADGVDKFTNPNVGGKIDRVAIKVAPTLREITIGAGGVANIQSYVDWFNGADPLASYEVLAWVNADPSIRLRGLIHGHASLAHAEPGFIQTGNLVIDINGTDVRLKNNGGSSVTCSLVVERKG